MCSSLDLCVLAWDTEFEASKNGWLYDLSRGVVHKLFVTHRPFEYRSPSRIYLSEPAPNIYTHLCISIH